METGSLSTALADRYIIDRLIGEGGMAKVYLARDLRHNRQVALKVLRPDLGAVVGVDRFQAEIQVTANLQHPNLLPLFDSGAAGDLLFYVMPYVQGESLRARLEREKQLPVDEVIRLATAISNALDYAHRQGVVHRDLKPENILIQEGQPLVADFGIALAISNAGGQRITQTGLSLGTPHYMSPEQATGDRIIDGRTDIYSLGALTYEMLTGEPPHVGATSQAIIARVLTERPRSIRVTRPSVPEHVELTVDRALEKLPADRWATAHEFAEALSGARVLQTAASRSGMSAAARGSRRETLAWSAAGILAASLIATTVWLKPQGDTAAMVEFDLALPESLSMARGTANAMALTRDGRTLVFSALKPSGRYALFVRQLESRFIQEIPGTEGALAPALSPDGKEVLFAARVGDAGVIKRIDIRGGPARTFADAALVNGQMSWGDDGRVVTANHDSLFAADADGANRRLLAAPDSARKHVRYGYPDVLPGSKAALIVIHRSRTVLDSAVLGVVSIPDGKVTELGVQGLNPRYSATGHIVYGTNGRGLFAVPFDARRLIMAGTPLLLNERVHGGSAGAVPVAVAANGTLVFVEGRTEGGRVRPTIVDRTGRERVLAVPVGSYRHPRVSPDGKQVALVLAEREASGANLENPDIWRLDVATGTLVRVTTNRSSDRPIWSRDGADILFSIYPKDSGEYAVSLYAGAKPRLVMRISGASLGTGDMGPAHGWAAFGVSSVPFTSDIWIAPMDSLTKARPFSAEPYVEALPRVSPDGKLVAYSTNRTGRDELYLRALPDGGEEVRVSSSGGFDPAWSADGKVVYFRADSAMMSADVIRTPKLAVGTVRALFPLKPYYQYATRSTYDVFPNGDFMMLGLVKDSVPRLPMIMRLNWRAGLNTASEKKQ